MDPNENEPRPGDDSLDAGLMAFYGSGGSSPADDDGFDDRVQPKTIGDFEILREIGRGAMGTVYLAEQVSLHRRVAIKVLDPAMCRSYDAVVRFRTEAASAARLRHPGIVQVHDFGRHEDDYHIAMEFVDGRTLQQVIAELRTEDYGALDGASVGRAVGASTSEDSATSANAAWDKTYVHTVCRLVIQVADAIQHAHDAGIIHRDVKPSNILVREDGTVVLTDFGLARVVDQPGVTRTAVYLGTPMYSSPEQAGRKNAEIDHRTDIFSLGVILYELLTLQHPFAAESTQLVLSKVVEQDPPDPRRWNRRLPRDLVTILTTVLQKDPKQRYPNGAAFAADLRSFVAFEPIAANRASVCAKMAKFVRRHRVACAAMAVVLVGGGGGGAWWWTRPGLIQLIGGFDSVTVRVGDRTLGTPPFPDPIEVEPGNVTIRFEADGVEYRRTDVVVTRVRTRIIDLREFAPSPKPERPANGGETLGGPVQKRVSELVEAARGRVEALCASSGSIDQGALDAALAAVVALAKEAESANRYQGLETARYEVMLGMQSIQDVLLRQSLHILPSYAGPEPDTAGFEGLTQGLEKVSEAIAKVKFIETRLRETLVQWIGELKTTQELIAVLQDAESASSGPDIDMPALRDAVDRMQKLDPESDLTRAALASLQAAVARNAREVDDALSIFSDPGGSLGSFRDLVAELRERGGLDVAHKDKLLDVLSWWEELAALQGLVKTADRDRLVRIEVPDFMDLPEELWERGKGLVSDVEDAVAARQEELDVQMAIESCEQMLRDRDLAEVKEVEKELLAFPSTPAIEGVIQKIEQLREQEGQWDAAEAEFEEFRAALARGEADVDDRYEELMRSWQAIRTWLMRAHETERCRHTLLVRRCTLYLRMGDPEAVLGEATKFGLLEGARGGGSSISFERHMFLGQANYSLSRFEAAESAFTAVLEMPSDSLPDLDCARTRYWRAVCRDARALRESGSAKRAVLAQGALKDLRGLDALGQTSIDVAYLQASLLYSLGRAEEAVAPAEAAANALGSCTFSEDETLAVLSRHGGKPSNAARTYSRDVHYACGEAYRLAGPTELLQAGIEEFSRALESDGEFARAHYTRGDCYGRLGKPKEAIKDFNEAIRLSGDNAALKRKAILLRDAYLDAEDTR